MKKITFLRANPKALGGAEIYLSRLVKSLQDQNIECEIKSLKMPKFISSWIKALVFNIYAKVSKKDKFYFSLERITSADIYRAGDGVHKIYMKSKPFWWINPLNFVYPYLEKKCFKNSKLVIANSNFIKNQIIDAYQIPKEKIKVIYNGVKIEQDFDKVSSKKAICQKFGLEFEKVLILFVGSGFARKGVDEFLKILANLDEDFNALVIGKDKKIDKFKKLSKELNLEKKVSFLGAINGVTEFYKASDIFIFPTKYEPFSNVILEALNFGNVAFTTTNNGASEVLESKFVIKEDNQDEILNLLKNLIKNRKFLQEEQIKARHIALNFSIEKNKDMSLSAIKSVLHDLEEKK